jgi:hypothetical protein
MRFVSHEMQVDQGQHIYGGRKDSSNSRLPQDSTNDDNGDVPAASPR